MTLHWSLTVPRSIVSSSVRVMGICAAILATGQLEGAPAMFYPVRPCRVADTRTSTNALGARTTRDFVVAGICGSSPTASAVAVNVTVTAPTTSGHIRVFRTGQALPATSTINYTTGQTRANNAIAAVGSGGAVSVYVSQASGSVHFILDVSGYFDDPTNNQPPNVSAGPDQTISLPAAASLRGTATDDGKPSATLTYSWTRVSGPGAVTFATPDSLSTTATFAIPGVYVLRLTVSDSQLSASADVTITVLPDPTLWALPEDRATLWNPGITSDPLGGTLGADGLPVRTTECATINASTYGNGSTDATAGINAAISACPAGQVVKLSAGTFLINDNYVAVDRDHVVLRGAGAGTTVLKRTNGAVMGSYRATVAMPVVIVGPVRWPHPAGSTSQNLTADGIRGAYSVTVADASGFRVGQIVLLDEMTKGAWQALPNENGQPTSVQVWAGDRAIWAYFNPPGGDDLFGPIQDGDLTGSAAGWFMRQDRPITEIKEIASIAGNRITFSDPLHIGYRVSHEAQVTGFDSGPAVQDSGVEALTVQGGSDGNFNFENAARCWAKQVENTGWLGAGFSMENSYRIVIRDSFIHDGAWPNPGGGGYGISFSNGTSESLVENSISLNVNKVMVARSSGAGSVIGYNYMDNGLILYDLSWMESGVNGSHMVGPHHMLFEGNYSFNADSDATWGASIYHTFFRNHLSGIRLGGKVLVGTSSEATIVNDPSYGLVRCAGLGYGSRWMSFAGNVLGRPGQMSGWKYEQNVSQPGEHYEGVPAIWMLGYGQTRGGNWDQSNDPQVLNTVIRDGNYDYLTNSVHWHTTPGFTGTLPTSLYLRSKPAFFGTNPWPWVDPLGSTKVHTLPAKARYDAGTPNVVP